MNLLDTAGVTSALPQTSRGAPSRRQRVQGCSVLAARSAGCTAALQSLHHSRPMSRPTRWRSTWWRSSAGVALRRCRLAQKESPAVRNSAGLPDEGPGGALPSGVPGRASASYFVNSRRRSTGPRHGSHCQQVPKPMAQPKQAPPIHTPAQAQPPRQPPPQPSLQPRAQPT